MNLGLKTYREEIQLFPFRVRCLERTKFEKILHEGFSSNYMFMNWCIMGSFLTHILLANYLSVLIQPKYEQPVETTQDVYDRGMKPYYVPSGHIFQEAFAQSEAEIFQELAKVFVIPEDWDEYDDLAKKAVTEGTYAGFGQAPYDYETEYGLWKISRETISITLPYGHYLGNKKWPLLEYMQVYLARLWQSGMTVVKIPFEQDTSEETLFALSLDYFYLGFGILISGELAALFFFIAENVIFRCCCKNAK